MTLRRTLVSRPLLGLALVSVSLVAGSATAQTAPPAPTEPSPSPSATPPTVTLAPLPTPVAAPVAPAPQPPPAPVPPAPATPGSIVEFSSLRLMLEKGIITKAEYDTAVSDIGASTGTHAPDATSLVVGRWSTTIYGFAEADLINDSTQSFNDTAGNAQVMRPNGIPPLTAAQQNTYGGNHGRTQMSVRNTRLGLQMRAPESHGIRVSGLVETDFEGYLPSPNATTGPTQSQFFSSPTLRLRHAYMKIETPVVDVLIGQYWDLFGWQNVYHPNSVEIQGLPGELYSRDAQIRLSHAFRSKAVDVEVAAAMRRPPSEDSQIPEGQGGLRISLPWWTGVTTIGATGTTVMPASLAVTGDIRQFVLPEFSQTPTRSVALTTEAIALDAFIPVIPQSRTSSGNALSLTGEFVRGSGISDLYTGLTMGLTFPTIPNTQSVEGTALPYPQDVDNGMVIYGAPPNATTPAALYAIQLTTFVVGAQYYLPGLSGHVWLSGNFARTQSGNIANFTRNPAVPASGTSTATNGPTDQTISQYGLSGTVRQAENFFDVNVFWDIISGARLGLEYANFNDQYVDGVHAINNRFQLSGFFIF